MRRDRAPWLILLVSWLAFIGWGWFERPSSDALESAQNVEEGIEARTSLDDSLEAANEALEALVAESGVRYTQDSIRWVSDRALEVRVRRVEQRAFSAAGDSLKAVGDSTVQALVVEMETAQAEIVRTFRLEISVLESQVMSLEEGRVLLFARIDGLEEQLAAKDLIILDWEEVNRLKDRHIGRAIRQKWYERTAAVVVLAITLAG